MSPTRRERIREATFKEIKSVAWKQIDELGVPALSLRAIAREMGMTAPGLYRYFPSRDALVTALIIDAFTSFSETLESSRDELPDNDHAGRYRAVCRAYFRWAAAHPSHYTLIFGAPVPGYEMDEQAYFAAQRGFLALQTVIGEAYIAGKIHPAAALEGLAPGILARYDILSQLGMPYPPAVTHLALKTWSEMHGVTSLYLSGYLSGFLGEQVDAYVDQTIEQLIKILGFDPA